MKRTNFPKTLTKHRPKKLPDNQISSREVLFVHEYLIDLDIQGAAIRARLVSENCNKKKRQEAAQNLFNEPRIQTYLDQAIAERITRTQITEDKVLSELANIAFYDPIDMFRTDGTLRTIQDMPKSIRQAISEIEYKGIYAGQGNDRVKTGYVAKIKLHDKLSANKTILSHLGKLPAETNYNVNYNQYNVQQNNVQNTTNTTNQIRMEDFTREELDVLKKMTGHEDPEEILELQEIEDKYTNDSAA